MEVNGSKDELQQQPKPHQQGEHEKNNKDPSSKSLLRSWAPITTRLLQKKVADSTSWYVMDHAIERPNFVACLRKELEEQGIIKSLSAARTNGELHTNSTNNEVAALLQGIVLLTNKQPPASSPISSVRGDKSTFVGREIRRQADQCSTTFPHLHLLIHKIESTAQHYLGHVFQFDFNATSVQVAEFPGDATSGYPRHCDRSGNTCREEHTAVDDAFNTAGQQSSSERLLTFVYYLTPDDDWDVKQDGGCLRLFGKDSDGKDHYVDVTPSHNRMVVFRADGVEHEVRPSLRRPRLALTVWLYGKVKDSSLTQQKASDTVEKSSKQNFSRGDSSVPRSTPGPPPLPISQIPTGRRQPTIFVSIAAYRDSETGPTLRHLEAMATHSERVFVGLVLQLEDNTDDSIANDIHTTNNSKWNQSNVRRINLEARHALGPCYARALCQSLVRGEDYVMQIDSHMRFRKHWDTYLIEHLEGLIATTNNDKVMMTTYPVGYQIPNLIPDETRGTLLVPWKFDQQGFLRQRGRLIKPQPAPIPSLLYAAGFNFSRSAVVEDCPYDQNMHHLFFGEELSMAVRLYTKGYDLYAPCESVCYHLWSRAHRPTHSAAVVKRDANDINDKWHAHRKLQSLEKVRRQLNGTADAGQYGLGLTRTVQEFVAALGVDFAKGVMLDSKKDSAPGLGQAAEFVGDSTGYAPNMLEKKLTTLDSNAKDLIAAFLQ